MKILFITMAWIPEDTDLPQSGGDVSNRLLIQALERNNDVRVSALFVPESEKGGCQSDIRFVCHMDRRYNISGESCIGYRFFLPVLFHRQNLQITNNFQPDVIVTAFRALPFALACGSKHHIPVCVLVRAFEHLERDNEAHGLVGRVRASIKGTRWGRYDLAALNQVDLALYNSEFLKSFYEEAGARVRGAVVFPPVDKVSVTGPTVPRRIRHVLMVRASHKKGHGVFVELARRHPDKVFHIAGVGPRAKPPDVDNIVTHGWTESKQEMFKDIDLVLMPSQWPEPFGRVAVEALQHGRLVLVSDIGGLPEAVDHEPDLLVPPSDIDAWDQALHSVSREPDKYAAACGRAARHVTMRYALDTQSAVLEEELSTLIRVGWRVI